MNQDFQIDSVSGDLVLDNGDLVLLADTETEAPATAQRLQTRLRISQGECFLDTDIGVPLFQSILGRKGVQDVADSAIKSVALGCPNIASLQQFTSSVNRTIRKYTATLVALTAGGTEVEVTA